MGCRATNKEHMPGNERELVSAQAAETCSCRGLSNNSFFFYFIANGEMTERLMVLVLKTSVPFRVPGVQIPLSPFRYHIFYRHGYPPYQKYNSTEHSRLKQKNNLYYRLFFCFILIGI